MRLHSTALPLALSLLSTARAQSTWYVDVAGTAPGTGSPGDPYTSLQYALDRPGTVSGDVLLVATGRYLESVDFRGKAVVVDGSAATTPPIFDAAGIGRTLTFVSGEGPTTLVRSVVVTGGFAAGGSVGGRGGGVLIDGASPRFELVVFEANRGTLGGGVAVRNGGPQFVDCTWDDNEAVLGGAVHVESASVTLVRGSVVNNRARGQLTLGGGLMLAGGASADIDSTTFEQNSTLSFGGGGGAIASDVTSTGAVVRDALFRANIPGDGFVVGFGAAIYARGPLQALRCTFVGNGGAAAFDSTVQGGACHGGDFTDCEFVGNSGQIGGALYQATASGCLFRQNQACADGSGAGGAAANCQLTTCVLVDNWACGDGGGAHNCMLTDCDVRFNRATGTFAGVPAAGGGLYGSTGVRTHLHGNEARNTASTLAPARGGGAYNCALDACIATCNRADIGGGVAYSPTSTLTGDRVTAIGNVATLQGGGVDGGTFRSSLVWHNFGGAISGSASFTYSNVEVVVPGVGNLAAYPLVFGPAGSDARLMASSPCIDAGDPLAPLDPDGSRADIGALAFDPFAAAAPANYCRPTRPLSQPACLPVIEGLGAASLSGAGSLTIEAREVTPSQLGILLLGFTPGALPFALSPNLEGTICIGPAFVRGRIQTATPGAACTGTFSQPVPAGFLAILGLQAGDRLHAQYWFRAASTTALTDALEIPIVP